MTVLRGRTRRGTIPSRVGKRAFDVLVGGILCVLALPVILVLAIGVAVSLRYWPFFVQKRPGWRGRQLTMVKLRTLPPSTHPYMHKQALGLATMKLPLLCRLLRRSHLDELPQLASVVLGQMSLVGPRPALPPEAEPMPPDFEAIRRSVRPGCTGMWQLSVAADGALATEPRFDLFYIRHASLRLDLWLLTRTIGWALGVAKPIEISDVPRWLLGSGLMAETARQTAAVPAARQPAGKVLAGPPVYARDPEMADALPAYTPVLGDEDFSLYPLDDELAEVRD